MMIITFNTSAKTITVTVGGIVTRAGVEGGVVTTYTEADKAQYLKDHPDRTEDIAAIGWAA